MKKVFSLWLFMTTSLLITYSINAVAVDVASFAQKIKDMNVIEAGSPGFTASFDVADDVAVIGAADGSDTGQVYIFTYDAANDIWVISSQLLTDDVVAGDRFGQVVSLDDEWLTVSAPNQGIINRGTIYMYKLNTLTDQWELSQKITTSNGFMSSDFGFQMVLSGDQLLVSEKDFVGVGTAPGIVYGYHLDAHSSVLG